VVCQPEGDEEAVETDEPPYRRKETRDVALAVANVISYLAESSHHTSECRIPT
jgi:hypothetical protein